MKRLGRYLNIILIVLTLIFLSSCANVVQPNKTATLPEQKDNKELDEKITKMNQKLEEIYHRISVIQFMVDNHERNFKDVDTKIKEIESVKEETQKIAELIKNDKSVVAKTEEKKENVITVKSEPEKKEEVKKPVKIVVKQPVEKKENLSVTDLYKNAYQEFRNKRYKKAIELFNRIVKEFPEDKLANNALYWTGEIYYDLKKYETSIVFFKRLIQRYPKGNKVPAATLKIGYAFIALGNKEEARAYLTKVVSNYPFSRAGAIAEQKLSVLK